jgi:hypothetical protein
LQDGRNFSGRAARLTYGKASCVLRFGGLYDHTSYSDNSVLLLLHEGGHGLDTSSGKTNSSRLSPGQHVVASGKHPASVLVTAMNAVGAAGNLGEVSGNIPQLLA